MPAGSKPGERRGGGKKGSVNKATADLRKLAQKHTAEALSALVKIATKGESEQARVAASIAILDRGHGKPTQTIAGDQDNPVAFTFRWETEQD